MKKLLLTLLLIFGTFGIAQASARTPYFSGVVTVSTGVDTHEVRSWESFRPSTKEMMIAYGITDFDAFVRSFLAPGLPTRTLQGGGRCGTHTKEHSRSSADCIVRQKIPLTGAILPNGIFKGYYANVNGIIKVYTTVIITVDVPKPIVKPTPPEDGGHGHGHDSHSHGNEYNSDYANCDRVANKDWFDLAHPSDGRGGLSHEGLKVIDDAHDTCVAHLRNRNPLPDTDNGNFGEKERTKINLFALTVTIPPKSYYGDLCYKPEGVVWHVDVEYNEVSYITAITPSNLTLSQKCVDEVNHGAPKPEPVKVTTTTAPPATTTKVALSVEDKCFKLETSEPGTGDNPEAEELNDRTIWDVIQGECVEVVREVTHGNTVWVRSTTPNFLSANDAFRTIFGDTYGFTPSYSFNQTDDFKNLSYGMKYVTGTETSKIGIVYNHDNTYNVMFHKTLNANNHAFFSYNESTIAKNTAWLIGLDSHTDFYAKGKFRFTIAENNAHRLMRFGIGYITDINDSDYAIALEYHEDNAYSGGLIFNYNL